MMSSRVGRGTSNLSRFGLEIHFIHTAPGRSLSRRDPQPEWTSIDVAEHLPTRLPAGRPDRPASVSAHGSSRASPGHGRIPGGNHSTVRKSPLSTVSYGAPLTHSGTDSVLPGSITQL